MNVFISYARQDERSVLRIEQELQDRGASVWRDQNSIYGGQQWPKAIGEAIAENDAILLCWSKAAAESHFVEFEWTTAMALRKQILPCLLDDEPLPPSLSAINAIPLTDFRNQLPKVIESLQHARVRSDAKQKANVLEKLGRIQSANAEEMARAGSTMMTQMSRRTQKKKPSKSLARAIELQEGDWVGSRYEVIRPLGSGGMGKVYQVYDRELERMAALKVIRSDLAQDEEIISRFKREVQLSSTITHRNVLRVYDLGESDGLTYLTMELVDGDDLASILEKEGRLPEARLLSYSRQICEGLAAAHEAGVLHRDLKPQNILVGKNDRIAITDFGLAKLEGQSGMTQVGDVMGTPYYMSPEQVRGEKVDSSSDVYSLGVLFYQMATGKLPFTGDTAYEIMMKRLQAPPAPVETSAPELPLRLVRTIRKALSIEKSSRYRNASELLRDLEPIPISTGPWAAILQRPWLSSGVALAALLLLFVAGFWIYQIGAGRSGVAVDAAIPSIGILPFENRTGDAGLDWYGEGIAGLIANNVSQSRHARVVSRERVHGVLSAAGGADLLQAAMEGGIDFLYSGEILSGSSGLVLTARLNSTATGEQVIGESIDGLSAADLLGASDRLSLAIRKGMGLPLAEAVNVFAADFAVENPQAYEAYVNGLTSMIGYNYQEAEAEFAKALELAPDFTMARYRFGQILATTGRLEQAQAELRRAAGETASLTDREARYVRAAEAWYSLRYDEAIEQYQDMLEHYPYETEARYFLAFIFQEIRQYENEIEQLNILLQLEPQNSIAHSMLGNAHLQLGDHEQAVAHFERFVALEPDSPNGHELLGDAFRAQGELNEAAQEYERALAIDPDFYSSVLKLGVVDALRERKAEAERRLMALATDGRVTPRHRLDGAIELAYLRRSQGRFREAAFFLQALEKEFAAEVTRESLGLVVRGLSLMELGDLNRAEELIERSVQAFPGVPTRYLFARGLLQLRQNDLEAVEATAAEIEGLALPPENPDRTEEKAAAFLRGVGMLEGGEAEMAVEQLSRAVELSGYEYSVYRLQLARALHIAGRSKEALELVHRCIEEREHHAPRLDLELDRTRALLLLAEIENELGRRREAAARAQQFLSAWASADPGVPELEAARRLSGASG